MDFFDFFKMTHTAAHLNAGGHSGSDSLRSDTWCLTSTETIRLIRDGEKGGKWLWRGGEREREIIYLSLHCHHQNDLH